MYFYCCWHPPDRAQGSHSSRMVWKCRQHSAWRDDEIERLLNGTRMLAKILSRVVNCCSRPVQDYLFVVPVLSRRGMHRQGSAARGKHHSKHLPSDCCRAAAIRSSVRAEHRQLKWTGMTPFGLLNYTDPPDLPSAYELSSRQHSPIHLLSSPVHSL